MRVGIFYVGRSHKGDLAEVMTEKDWNETDPQDFRPNTNWAPMTLGEVIADDEVRSSIMDIRVRDILVE